MEINGKIFGRDFGRLQTLKTKKEKGNSMARRDTNTKQQTFNIIAPGAMSVMLAGDFTYWQEKAIPMQKQAGGYEMGDPIPSDYRTHPVALLRFLPK
jgi:1,4-alpha-glucan branching enzyme